MSLTLDEAVKEALRRIAVEAERRTGVLFLSGLDLPELPQQLAELGHLTELSLGMILLDAKPGGDIGAECSLDVLACMPHLERLQIAHHRVTNLKPLRGLQRLCDLRVMSSPVRDLSPLVGMQALEHLEVTGTDVAVLRPLGSLRRLRYLNCSLTPASDWQALRPLWERHKLETLIANGVDWAGLPPEVLSQSWFYDNCLPRLRAHLADLDAGAVEQRQTKLMVLGNGRVGKTQLVRRLRQEPFDDTVPSTHGVVVTTAELPPAKPGAAPDRLHVWDFGGQDLYHGTHALFMKSGSTALVAWNPAAETAGTHVHGGMRFRNEPLSYWLEFVRGAAGNSAPLLLVQTQCDQPGDEVLSPPVPAELLAAFGHKKLLHTSARGSGRGLAALGEALQEAVDALLAQQGAITIGAGRARLIDRLAALRDADAARPEDHRQHRTLSQAQFAVLCEQAGGIHDAAMALDYLHRCGWVFYRDDMFNQAIVLDQAWALENIYAVFHRAHSYHHIRALRGRFTLGLLQDTVWRGKTPTESQVLLDMMRSCEVCFEVRAADADQGIEAEYIAPELLPEAALLSDSLAAERAKMPADAPRAELRWAFGFLHSGHLRAALSRVGRCAGEHAWYWRDGFLGYEVRHRAWLELDVSRDSTGHGGSVRFQAVGAQVQALLDEVRQAMPADWGSPVAADGARAADARQQAMAEPQRADAATGTVAAPALAFAPSPRADGRPNLAISYKWGDATSAGRARDALVDRVCSEAHKRYALRVWRDADVMRQGERISRFMRELAAHDKVVVILSDGYLKSEYCMFELSEIWRQARRDGDDFLRRVAVWAMPDARIHSILDRLAIASHWRETFSQLDAAVRSHGPALLGEADMVKFKHIERYAAEVGDMLALIADTLLPRNADTDFEPFLQRCLGN